MAIALLMILEVLVLIFLCAFTISLGFKIYSWIKALLTEKSEREFRNTFGIGYYEPEDEVKFRLQHKFIRIKQDLRPVYVQKNKFIEQEDLNYSELKERAWLEEEEIRILRLLWRTVRLARKFHPRIVAPLTSELHMEDLLEDQRLSSKKRFRKIARRESFNEKGEKG